jgi:short-subunit dehydrogenase
MGTFVFGGGTCVVTGAASGIGAALARALADRGANLVLLDRDAERLAEVAASIRSGRSTMDDDAAGTTVETHVVDLADPAATARVAAAVLAAHPAIRLLVNNAGVALGGRFDQVTLDEFDWVIDINFRAVVHLTHALLPALKAEPGSHLVNVSSLFGLIAPGGQAAYSASKFAVRGFTEALRQELSADGIGVTCVHPGGINTRIAESARVGSGVPAEIRDRKDDWKKLLTMDPAKAAAIILRGVEHRRGRVLIGGSAKVLDVVARLLPSSYGRILAAAAKRRSPPARTGGRTHEHAGPPA